MASSGAISLCIEEDDDEMSALEAMIGLAESFPELKPLLDHSNPAQAGEWKGMDDMIKPGYSQEVLDDYTWPDPAPLSDEELAEVRKRLRDLPETPMRFRDKDEK